MTDLLNLEPVTETAYANLLESLEIAVEATDGEGVEYVIGYDGNLWHAESGGEPSTVGADTLEELLDYERVYVCGWLELYEFSEVLPADDVER